MNFNQELDTMWEKDNRIAQLEEELAKVTARYNCVRDMTPDDFGNLSTINDDFDRKIDELIKERIAQLEADLAEARKDQARYQYVIDWLESNVIATAAFTHARTKSEYDQAIDAATKEQQ